MSWNGKLYRVQTSVPSISMENLMNKHTVHLAKARVEAVSYAIDEHLEQITVAEFITVYRNIVIIAYKPKYKETLEEDMETLIKAEEYLSCAIARDALEKLKNIQESQK